MCTRDDDKRSSDLTVDYIATCECRKMDSVPKKYFLSPPSSIMNVTADDVPGYSVELSVST